MIPVTISSGISSLFAPVSRPLPINRRPRMTPCLASKGEPSQHHVNGQKFDFRDLYSQDIGVPECNSHEVFIHLVSTAEKESLNKIYKYESKVKEMRYCSSE